VLVARASKGPVDCLLQVTAQERLGSARYCATWVKLGAQSSQMFAKSYYAEFFPERAPSRAPDEPIFFPNPVRERE